MHPTRHDFLVPGGGLLVVLLVITLWLLFPVYLVEGNRVVRRPVWNPPQLPVGHGHERLSAEEIERLSVMPGQREILEDMRNLPRSHPAPAYWLGNRYGPPKNPVIVPVFLAIAGYFVLLRHRGVI